MFEQIINYIKEIPPEAQGFVVGFLVPIITKKVFGLFLSDEKVAKMGRTAGKSISIFLRKKTGKKIENIIEKNVIIPLKFKIDILLDNLVIGLRSDNEERKEAEDLEKIDRETNKIARERAELIKEKMKSDSNNRNKKHENETKQRIEDLKSRLGV